MCIFLLEKNAPGNPLTRRHIWRRIWQQGEIEIALGGRAIGGGGCEIDLLWQSPGLIARSQIEMKSLSCNAQVEAALFCSACRCVCDIGGQMNVLVVVRGIPIDVPLKICG